MFMYMMAWQYQHFYGIRWIYYDDYNNAGFKMEKNKSIASAQVMGSTILSIVLMNYSLHYFGVTSCFVLGLPLTLGMYHWGIKSTIAFSKGEISPK
jgi:heme O synthase-like polyprenyltransferase